MEEQIIPMLKALADQTRLDIVRKLVNQDECVRRGNLTCNDLSQPVMSHHFAKLVDAGVLIESKSGKEKFYSLNIELLHAHGIDPSRL